MIELIATAESVEQAKELIDSGIDMIYVGEDMFGLRLPASLPLADIEEITAYAHQNGKQVCVAVNALFHNDRIKKVVPYLQSLEKIGVDFITVGDPGVVRLLQKNEIQLSYIYDGHTLVTSARQVNFWAKRGAKGAVLAREITYEELKLIAPQVQVPVEILVYGATCIHHSKRPLVSNYFEYIGEKGPNGRGLFISEPKQPDTHYSIYEDINGTHIFATDDVNLLPFLDQLVEIGLKRWKLDGIFTPGQAFVDIARLFVQAREAINEGKWTEELKNQLNEQLRMLHPKERTLDPGFYVKHPDEVQ